MTVLSILAAYLIGSIPFTFLIAKWKGNIDLRESGSRNVGGRNLARHFGWGWGAFGAFLDLLKGAAAILITGRIFNQVPAENYYAAIAVVAGHNWPLYLRFHGGKGLATAAGAILAIAPGAAVAGGIGAVLFLALFRLPIAAGLFGFVAAASAIPLLDYAQELVWLVLGLLGLSLSAVLLERIFKRRNPATN